MDGAPAAHMEVFTAVPKAGISLSARHPSVKRS